MGKRRSRRPKKSGFVNNRKILIEVQEIDGGYHLLINGMMATKSPDYFEMTDLAMSLVQAALMPTYEQAVEILLEHFNTEEAVNCWYLAVADRGTC
jgi:hypothetical protein